MLIDNLVSCNFLTYAICWIQVFLRSGWAFCTEQSFNSGIPESRFTLPPCVIASPLQYPYTFHPENPPVLDLRRWHNPFLFDLNMNFMYDLLRVYLCILNIWLQDVHPIFNINQCSAFCFLVEWFITVHRYFRENRLLRAIRIKFAGAKGLGSILKFPHFRLGMRCTALLSLNQSSVKPSVEFGSDSL